MFFSILSYYLPSSHKRPETLPPDPPLGLRHGPTAKLAVPPDPDLYCRIIL